MSEDLPVSGVPPARQPIQVDAPRLWAGGLSCAVVAALIAWIGVLIGQDVLGLRLSKPALLLRPSGSFAGDYALTAAVLALAATGLAHVLSLTTPRPRAFFGWIVGLLTAGAMAVPFARGGELSGKLAVATVNLVIGIAIGSLLTAVLSRTVVDPDHSWQEP